MAAQREEAQRRVREERRLAEEAKQRRNRWVKRLRTAAIYAAVGIGVFILAIVVLSPNRELDGITQPARLELRKLATGETFDYGSATPTSGPYRPGEPACGVFTEQLAAEDAVTALYNGAIVLWHTPEADPALIASLADLARTEGDGIVVSPNSGIDQPIVATAWRRLRAHDTVSADLAEFVDVYRGRAPESLACPVG